MPSNKVVALLPMKGNSERVPNKNLKNFGGRPLFYSVLESLSNSEYIDSVIINTDSQRIADAAAEFKKVKIHWRPEAICGDMVSMNKVIAYDLEHSDETHFLQTHSTNPLLKTQTIDSAIERYFDGLSKGFDSVFSVTELKTRLYTKEIKPMNHNPEELIRTQDLEPIYEENSNFYIFSKASFAASGEKRIGVKPLMYPVDKLESMDIDTPADFIITETIHNLNLV